MPKIISDAGEQPLVLHSEVRGPIRELSFLQRALLFAELSMVAYNDPDEASRAAAAVGFDEANLYDNDGSQAYRFRNPYDCVIACRGTEADQWNDIQADVNVATVLADTVGHVHSGFKREVDDLWPMLEEVLANNRLPLWFCGHSLGGAMATISAGRCVRSHIPSNPEELFSFGSPRVGDRSYVNFVKIKNFRFVNNNDVVTRVPPPWLGYRHCGTEIYFDHRNRISPLNGWQRSLDRLRGTLRGLVRGRVDPFADHTIHCYIDCLLNELAAQEANDQGPTGTPAAGQPRWAPGPPHRLRSFSSSRR